MPRTWQAHLEIAKAIRTLAARDEEEQPRRHIEYALPLNTRDLAAEIAREILQDLRKAGFNPDEPRVPRGQPGGGRWTNDGTSGATRTPTATAGIGHNQGPPLEEPPAIPPKPPATPQALTAFLKAAAYWLTSAGKVAAARYLARLQMLVWLTQSLPYIYAYIYPPKTLAELQQDALNPQPGYNIHHIVEQKSARDDKFSDDMIDGPDNLVRIPTLRHWQITTWYQTQNKDFGGLSPRDYLQGKSWDERRRVGLDALIKFGVLKP